MIHDFHNKSSRVTASKSPRRTGFARGRRPVWGGSAPCAALTCRNSCSSRLRRETDRIGEECSRKHSAPFAIGRALRAGMKPMAGKREVGASQCSVVRAAVCTACGLWSLTLPALAQAPAPTADLPKPIPTWQGGKPVEFRNEGVGHEVPWNVEEQVLLPLFAGREELAGGLRSGTSGCSFRPRAHSDSP